MDKEKLLTVFNLSNSALIFTSFGVFNMAINNHKGAFILFGIALVEILAMSITLGIALFGKNK